MSADYARKHVTVNEKKIDWINRGSNYDDVVTQAVHEAAGHAFVTKYAGPSSILDNLVYRDGQYNLERLRTLEDPAPSWTSSCSRASHATRASSPSYSCRNPFEHCQMDHSPARVHQPSGWGAPRNSRSNSSRYAPRHVRLNG